VFGFVRPFWWNDLLSGSMVHGYVMVVISRLLAEKGLVWCLVGFSGIFRFLLCWCIVGCCLNGLVYVLMMMVCRENVDGILYT
jgi:hypothetical protein